MYRANRGKTRPQNARATEVRGRNPAPGPPPAATESGDDPLHDS